MAAVDKTAAILSTLYGFIPDEAQLELFREHLRSVSLVRDVGFTIHEVSMRATSTAGTPVDKEIRVRTITEDAQITTIRVWNPGKLASVVETREVSDSQASPNAESWLTQLGFTFGFEFYKEGFRYMSEAPAIAAGPGTVARPLPIHIFIYKLKKLSERGNFQNAADLSPGYMVEFQCEEDPQTKFGERLLNFARAFSTLVTLSDSAAR